jgi:hypothetical protein
VNAIPLTPQFPQSDAQEQGAMAQKVVQGEGIGVKCRRAKVGHSIDPLIFWK